MRKIIYSVSVVALIIVAVTISCQKAANNSSNDQGEEDIVGVALTPDEESMVKAAGFDATYAEKRPDGFCR